MKKTIKLGDDDGDIYFNADFLWMLRLVLFDLAALPFFQQATRTLLSWAKRANLRSRRLMCLSWILVPI
jgi:hypothetical protein